jgi:hypothetical protein
MAVDLASNPDVGSSINTIEGSEAQGQGLEH